MTWYWNVDGKSYQKWEKFSFDVNNEIAARHPTTTQGSTVHKYLGIIKLQMPQMTEIVILLQGFWEEGEI